LHLAKAGVLARYGSLPRYTYAVGTSNGGYQVRRAMETRHWSLTAASIGRAPSSTIMPPTC